MTRQNYDLKESTFFEKDVTVWFYKNIFLLWNSIVQNYDLWNTIVQP